MVQASPILVELLTVNESLTVVLDAGCSSARAGQGVNFCPVSGIALELIFRKPEVPGIPGTQGHEHFQDVSLCFLVRAESIKAPPVNMNTAKFHKHLFETRFYHSAERLQKELVKSYSELFTA
jgi:hypothetical protein